jgi:hypothetical protein
MFTFFHFAMHFFYKPYCSFLLTIVAQQLWGRGIQKLLLRISYSKFIRDFLIIIFSYGSPPIISWGLLLTRAAKGKQKITKKNRKKNDVWGKNEKYYKFRHG